ncbi:MAG: L-seryl-tRNA(Sec) selenium transferase [Candidatus Latescibacteria bacterium]|jgi:L-seryl-tRNA(Ser) seleniumtransferase|nr:L-seryl-tRNA(Sec) selenium transferase [Candidatus Latescibacterota bacterium]
MSSTLLSPAINGTGVILHTGLGRAVLSQAASDAVAKMGGYCTIELDIDTGKRGSRHEIVSQSICELTGAESAIVVNNNAAAVLLILSSLSSGKDVIMSRGQLVEIGGSFRMPDVMEQSGARLVSVGSVNHTTIEDFRAAITDQTSLIFAVHRSNFGVVGDDQEVPLDQLVTLGREFNIPVAHDIGSGVLTDLSVYGLSGEATVQDSVREGVSIVCFSGDKLMGGPQAGIIIGENRLLRRMKSNPIMRALRVDKLTFAALAATIELFRDADSLPVTHPVIRMISTPIAQVNVRADQLCRRLGRIFGSVISVSVEDSTSEIGGGTMPSHRLPTRVVSLTPSTVTNHEVASLFRRGKPPVFGRLKGERFLMDARTLSDTDCDSIEKRAKDVYRTLEIPTD